jgi:ribosomal protein L32E
VNHKNTHTKSKVLKKNASKVISIQYVLPLGGNGWVVKNNKAAKFTVITDSKREAISIARNIAKNKQIELVVHGRDGSIEIRENYAIAN